MQKTRASFLLFAVIGCLSVSTAFARQTDTVRITLSVKSLEQHLVHVTLTCHAAGQEPLRFKMPQWTPGYYQIMHYAKYVRQFTAKDGYQNILKWDQPNSYTWTVYPGRPGDIILDYDVIADRSFVASSIADSAHAYITPAGTFMYLENGLTTPILLAIHPYAGWSRVANGLDSIAGKPYTYVAPHYDLLYDCPILMGNLEELHPFTVRSITHRFIGYKLGDFDKAAFMTDLKQVVEAGVNIIQDVPYKHYTFLAIGPGNGGIEHLTSSALSFSGTSLNAPERKKRTLSFIAHEYFHHYNVKRIRPIELGPFDYENGSKTKQLWISEGWTVYYEYLMLKRAGLIADSNLYNYLRSNIRAYETGPGRHFQSLAQASEETWSDGPFGRRNEEINKTISYYDKGPVVALMLDFAIRHHTGNSQSLDGVMRRLYNEYYKKQGRGFTEAEFRNVCEQTAGTPLPEIFDYVNTTKELNYAKYFGYGGLTIDTATALLSGAYSGLQVAMVRDTLTVTKVDWPSPAWDAGIRSRAKLLAINNQPASLEAMNRVHEKPGASLLLTLQQDGKNNDVTITTVAKTDRSFLIRPLSNPDALQARILKSWLGD